MAFLKGSMPTGETLYGVVSSIGPKYGFIKSDAIPVDIFCIPTTLEGLSVGQPVQFGLNVSSEGKPQAAWAMPAGKGKGGGGGKGKGKGTGKGGGPPPTMPTGEAYFGVIEQIGPKFGFVNCPPVMNKYGENVFVPGRALQGYSIGDKVEFELVVNVQGQPSATEVWGKGMGKGKGGGWKGDGKGKGKDDTMSTKFGTVKSIGIKYGFINCPPVMAQCGQDVFCPTDLLFGFDIGDSVNFELYTNEKGQPNAMNVRPRDSGKGWSKGKGWDDGKGYGKSGGKGQKMKGTVKSIGPKFGFITSEAVMQSFGSDVFVPVQELMGCSPGMEVRFEMVVNDTGRPQGTNITPAGSKGGGKGGWKRGGPY